MMSKQMDIRKKTNPARTWQPTREFLQFIEGHAAILRQRAKVGPSDRLDPRQLTQELGITVASLNDLVALTPEDRELLSGVDAKEWSGMGIPLSTDKLLVILHPNQTPERASVTIMEEVCHSYFGHKPSQLITQASGIVKRQYDEIAEREAYWTASATLLPSEVVAKAVWRGRSAEEIAIRFGASTQLVEMRIKTLLLWDEYEAHLRKAS